MDQMTPEQIARVRSTWALALAAGDDLAVEFYDRLFAAHPELRGMFAKADPAAQAEKLTKTLEVVVHGLDNLDHLRHSIAAMGQRHSGYGVQGYQYALVGEVLIQTLQHVVGASFSDADQAAWVAAYTALASVMQQGASDTQHTGTTVA